MTAKRFFDNDHYQLFLRVGSEVYIRLHRGYTIPAAHRKLGQQRIGPFKILERIGRLAYRLELPEHWRIHPVVSVTHLEPREDGPNPYERSRPKHPLAVFVDGDIEYNKSFEIEKIIDKRTTPLGRVKYLVR